MKWKFKIYANEESTIPLGELLYDWDTVKWTTTIYEIERPTDLPLLLQMMYEKGYREIDDRWTRRLLSDRVTPPDRQGIGYTLKVLGFPYYDEAFFLRHNSGRNCQDETLIRFEEEIE